MLFAFVQLMLAATFSSWSLFNSFFCVIESNYLLLCHIFNFLTELVYFKWFTEKPEWVIWLIWAMVGQCTDRVTQKCVKNESLSVWWHAVAQVGRARGRVIHLGFSVFSLLCCTLVLVLGTYSCMFIFVY